MRSLERAQGEWERLWRKNSDLLGKLALSVAKADLGPKKGVFYRLRAGPVADEAAARALCAKLARHKMGCIWSSVPGHEAQGAAARLDAAGGPGPDSFHGDRGRHRRRRIIRIVSGII